MPNTYTAKKEFGFGLIFLLCPLVCWVMPLAHPNLLLFLFAVTISVIFLWIWFGTYYQLDDEYLICRSGPFRKKVPVRKIVRIARNVRAFSGRRPALSFRYLQIRYNTYDDVFIAPENEEAFIADLIRVRPEISTS